MAPRLISVIGSLVLDLISVADRLPERGEVLMTSSFSQHPGGKAANTAVAAYRLSHRRDTTPNSTNTSALSDDDEEVQVRVSGAVGNDEFAKPLLKALIENNIDTSGVRTLQGVSSGISSVIFESKIKQNRILYTPGANFSISPEEFTTLESLAGGLRPDLLILQYEITRSAVEQILQTAAQEGIEVLLNLAPAQIGVPPWIYKGLGHLVVNETEAAILTGRSAEDLEDLSTLHAITDYFLQMGVKNIVITLGDRGAYYSNDTSAEGLVEAVKNCNVVDTTGAGDTFIGAYAAELLRQKNYGNPFNVEEAVRFACRAAARTIERLGALEAIPWLDEV